MDRSGIRILAFLIACLSATSFLRAQGDAAITVEARLSTRQVFVGEALVLEVRVNGTQQAVIPEPLEIEGFDVEFAGSGPTSSTFQITINGRAMTRGSQGVVYQWRLAPTTAGDLTIPRLEIEVNGKAYPTTPLFVRVLPPQADSDVRFFVNVDNTNPFAGEPIKLTVTLARRDGLSEGFLLPLDFQLPSIKGPFRVVALPQPQFSRDDPILLLGQLVHYASVRMTIDGDRWVALVAEVALVPQRPGRFELTPANAVGTLSMRGRSIFDRRQRRFSVPADPLTIEVKPLPQEGRPSNFSGLVGRYSIYAQATPDVVNVGDPIDLTIRISGPLPGAVEAPALDRQMDLISHFRVGEEEVEPRVVSNAMVFTRTLRAISDDVGAIPSIELPYFNVETSRYEVARTPPIPIEVRPTRIVTSADAEGSALRSGPSGTQVEERAGGIRYNIGVDQSLVDQRFVLGQAIFSPLGLAAVVAPPAIYSVVALVVLSRRRSSRDEAKNRRRGALGRATQSLSASEEPTPAAISATVRCYFADVFDRPGDGLTTGECAALIGDCVSEEQRARATDLLDRCDQAVFGGVGAEEARTLSADTKTLLEEVDQVLRRVRA